jgi:integrase
VSKDNSPFVYGDYWLDKRRDGLSPEVWQIARLEGRSVIYRSTRKRDLDEAIAVLEAHVAKEKGAEPQEVDQAGVAVILVNYWTEKGRKAINSDQTQRSLYTFIAFLLQDKVGARAVVTDLTPSLFERFREWRMQAHAFELPWFGRTISYKSKTGVSGATVQRNINDVRAAVYYAESETRIAVAPKIKDVPMQYRGVHKDRILTEDELARIVWYSAHNKDLFRFVCLQIATSVRPNAALLFNPKTQYDDRRGIIDLQPDEAPQTKKRNAIIPAIRPLRPILRAWAKEPYTPVGSRKTAWRIMRRVLGLTDDVKPKTIRYTIATWLYEMEWVPERQISEMLGHVEEGGQRLARTSRIYAKYRPEKMGLVVKALTIIWRRLSLQARKYSADHLLTIGQRAHKFEVVKRKKKPAKSGILAGGRDRD